MKEKVNLSAIKKRVALHYRDYAKIPEESELLEFFEVTPEQLKKYFEFLRDHDFIIKDSNGVESIQAESYSKILTEMGADEKTEEKPSELELFKESLNNSSKQDLSFGEYSQFVNRIKRKSKKQPQTNKSMIPILRWVMLFIGIGATYMSIYFSYMWLNTFLNPFRAVLLSIIMVVYGVASFELTTLLWGRYKRILAMVFGVLSALVITFSMVSTVAGQYNNRIAQIAESNKSKTGEWKQVREYENYKEQKADLEKQLTYHRTEDSRLTQLLLNYQSIEQIESHRGVYNQLNRDKRGNDYKQKTVLKKLDVLEKKKPEIVRDLQSSDFYAWVGGVLGIAPDKFQFWLSLFPALFIDLAAPLSIAVFLFVREQEGENEPKIKL